MYNYTLPYFRSSILNGSLLFVRGQVFLLQGPICRIRFDEPGDGDEHDDRDVQDCEDVVEPGRLLHAKAEDHCQDHADGECTNVRVG